jgi:ribose transport system ATP-binding protein
MRNVTGVPVLRAEGLTKRYPGVVALDGVDFALLPGEVHVLFGENGAGKSTLIGLLAGSKHRDAGSLHLRGEPVELHDVADARKQGIGAVFQEFSLAPSLTVEENLLLGMEPTRFGVVDRRAMRRTAIAQLERFGFELEPTAVVSTLGRAEQQMVEIAKAFRDELSVLILDEPTASLTDQESARLFELIDQARRRGVGIVYVTHRMAEIRQLADRVTVLRDGKLVATVDGDTPEGELITLMTGRVVDDVYPDLPTPGTVPVLTAAHLSTADGRLVDGSFEVRAGEIVGFSGLVGSGKSAAARACFGLTAVVGGSVRVHETDMTGATPARMLAAGVVYLPSDRKREGLFAERPLRESVTLPWLGTPAFGRNLLLFRGAERRQAAAMMERMDLSPPDPERVANSYSGGNQQKALLGRALLGDCKIYLLDEPTVGVDVGARVGIYAQIIELAAQGNAVIIISSDLPEILHLCHRTYVFATGRITAELAGDEITEASVLHHMMHWDTPTNRDAA